MIGFLSAILILLGTVLFSFAFWRKLKDDYENDEIFTSTLMLLFGGLIGWFVVGRWFEPLVFWGFALGFLISGIYATVRLGLKSFETIDSMAWAFFWLWVFVELRVVFMGGLGRYGINLLPLTAPILGLFVYRFLDSRYRRFSWYPSGKIGFLGLASFAVYFFFRAAVAFTLFGVLSFPIHFFDGLLSFFLVWAFVLAMYLRSGRRRAEKVGITLKRIRKGWGFK
jgi:hypothetical protein